MKKFLLHIFLFLLTLVAGVVILFSIPVDRKYAYNFISKGGCQGRPPWIYQRIYEDTTAIDIAFIGTSHTMNAVNDEWLEKTLFDSTGKRLTVRNLSFCGFGRDFDYVLVKDLVEHKKVKALVLEVRENESQLGHLSFPYVATSSELFTAPKYFNRSYLPAIYKALLFRLQYLRESFTHEDIRHQTEIAASPFGFNGNNGIANPEDLDKEARKALEREKKKNASIENALNTLPQGYINQIADLAKANGVKLLFIYLPAYENRMSETELKTFYAPKGQIIFPDEQVLRDKANWADYEHLNISGEQKISPQILKVLRS